MAFGAKIKLSVDQNRPSDFRKEIQTHVDLATASKPIYIKNLKTTKAAIKELMTDLQSKGALVLNIKKIDATQAVKNLRAQLETMLSGLSITGLKEFLGSESIEQITQGIENAKQSTSAWAGQMQVVSEIQKSLAATYKSAIGNQAIDGSDMSAITAQYTAWQQKVAELKNTKVALSEEDIANLQREGIELQQIIALIQREQTGVVEINSEWAAQASLLSEAQKRLATTYSSAVSGKNMLKGEEIDGITAKYNDLALRAKNINGLTEEELTILTRETTELQRQIALLQQKQAEEAKNAITADQQAAIFTKESDKIRVALASLNSEQYSGVDPAKIQAIRIEYDAWQAKIDQIAQSQSVLSKTEVANEQLAAAAIRNKIAALKEEHVEQDKSAAQQATLTQQIQAFRAQVEKYAISHSKVYSTYRSQFKSIFDALDNGDIKSIEALNVLKGQFRDISVTAQEAGVSGKTFFDTFSQGLAKFGGWSLVTRSMMAVYRLVRNMVSAVKDLDAAMTELKKVTDLTNASYERFALSAQQTAKRIGATVSDTINATADFARLGFNIDDASMLAEAALVYKNVGDGIDDISIATESLISTFKAFGGEASEAMGIVDEFNEVGKFVPNGMATCRKKVAISVKGQKWLRPRKDLVFVK